MIQLYQYEVCPYCCKVKAVLDYKKIPYETVEVTPMSNDELPPEAKEHDKVPVLVDGKKVIVESNDIIRYLDKKYPDKPVFAKSEQERVAEEKWINFVDEDLVQILPANIYRTLPEALDSFKYITKVGKFPLWKRYYMALGGAVAMTIVARKGMKKRGILDPRKSLEKSLSRWSEGLGKNPFMGGGRPDVSDLVCAGVLSAVRGMKVWKFIRAQKPIAAWYDRVEKFLQ